MPSPIKESIPNFLPPLQTELQAPPSPRTHRTLRRLQSAHSLGAKAGAGAVGMGMGVGSATANPPSLIALQRQQREQQRERELQREHHHQPHHPQHQLHHHHYQSQQRTGSPVRRDFSGASGFTAASSNRSPQRARANSDAAMVHGHLGGGRRSLTKRTNAVANALSLQQLLRDGPPEGDVGGALESARVKVLDDGIKSDGDGMVRIGSRCLVVMFAPAT